MSGKSKSREAWVTGNDGKFAVVAFVLGCGGSAGACRSGCTGCSGAQKPARADNPLGAQPGDHVAVTRSWRVKAIKIGLPVAVFFAASLISDAAGAKAGLSALITIAAVLICVGLTRRECRRRGLGLEISEILEDECSDTSGP